MMLINDFCITLAADMITKSVKIRFRNILTLKIRGGKRLIFSGLRDKPAIDSHYVAVCSGLFRTEMLTRKR